MQTETPRYVKKTGLTAAALVAPFFFAVTANSISMWILNRNLENSWVWSTPILVGWVLILPAAAFIIAFSGYLRLAFADNLKSSIVRRLFDYKHSWPVTIPALVALGILAVLVFHDSAHCLIGNPIETARNASQTWRCVDGGLFGGK